MDFVSDCYNSAATTAQPVITYLFKNSRLGQFGCNDLIKHCTMMQ